MTTEELAIKKFELEQQIQIEELALKKKELELKIAEQKKATIFTPLVISIVGGLITLITGIVLKFYDNKATTELEDKKFQSTLLLKATEATNYEEFSNMLLVLQDNGLLSLDSGKLANFRKKKFIADKITVYDSISKKEPLPSTNQSETFYWIIVAGGDANLDGARFEQKKSIKYGFTDTQIWLRNNSYRTCIGKYWTYETAVNDLFDVKEKINNTAYIVRNDKWCINKKYNDLAKYYVCQ